MSWKSKNRQRSSARRSRAQVVPGSRPGELVTSPDSPAPSIRVVAYDEGELFEEALTDLTQLAALRERWPTVWINVEDLSDAVFQHPHDSLILQIHETKHDFMVLRRAIFPLRETLNALQRDDVPQIAAETRVYLRDAYDHVIQLMDLVETYREMSGGLMEAYQSSVGYRTNEVMRVLTIFATIFIPLTFVAGIYGMNFDREASPFNLPELGWAYGYPAFWGVMVLIAGALLVFFRRKGWLGGTRGS